MRKALNPDVITTKLIQTSADEALKMLKEMYSGYNRAERHHTTAETRFWAQEYKRLAAMTLILLEKVVKKEP